MIDGPFGMEAEHPGSEYADELTYDELLAALRQAREEILNSYEKIDQLREENEDLKRVIHGLYHGPAASFDLKWMPEMKAAQAAIAALSTPPD